MTRVSLKEAYDNKDVAVQIFGLKDDVARIDEVIENLPNPDLTNCVIKDTEQTITGEKTFTKMIHAEGGIEVNTEGGFEIDGPLTVNGDIIQNGQAYETHAEQVFSQNDLIVTRDGAVSALPAGVVSGIQIKKYDGVNDARLAVDNAGVARVGDVGDEQPLMTRAEVADMVGGAFLKWDAVHAKAISGTLDDAPTAGSSNGVKSSGIKSAIDSAKTELSGDIDTLETTVNGEIDALETTVNGKVTGTGNIGSDTKPIKIVDGVAVPVTENLVENKVETIKSGTGYTVYRYGKLIFVRLEYVGNMTITDCPRSMGYYKVTLNGTSTANAGQATIYGTTIDVNRYAGAPSDNMLGTLIYLTSD